MSAAIDFANIASGDSIIGALTFSINCTCAASDNLLLVCVGTDQNSAAAPTSVTYNGVAMTAVPSGSEDNTQEVVTWFYMNNPPTGSAHPILATYAANYNACVILGIPMSGVNLAAAPVAGTGTSGIPSASIACSAPSPDANSIAFGATQNRGTTQIPGGAPQTNVIAPLNNINAGISYACSYILGPNPANFTWTITSANWSAIGVTVQGTSSGGGATPPVLTPPSTTIAASTTAAASAFAPNTQAYAQIKISNQTASWAFVNFGVAGSVNAATVATGLPLAPGMERTVSIDPEVTGASVILATGSGSVVFSPLFWPHYP